MREHDPIAAWLRSSRSQRRVGPGAVCASCGKESRPYALMFGREPPCCHRCDRIAHGHVPYEDNHVFGKRNGDLTIRYPINDHRAVLSVAQYRWPPGALENPNGSALLASVAESHGLYDNTEHMLAEHKANSARLLHVEELLVAVYGQNWLPALEAAAALQPKLPARRAKTRRSQ
jgi:hypothetical protein